MKNKIIFTFITIFLILLLIKFFPFGTKYYNIFDTNDTKIKAPKLSKYEEVCCMYSAEFKSVRSAYILKKELDNIVKNYKILKCNNQTYFYDEKNDITIVGYSIERGFLFNKFHIVFDEGNSCNEKKQLTLEDVIELSNKKHELTFKDFDDYSFISIGSGLIINEYRINENYKLIVGGFSLKPMYVKLMYSANNRENDYLEIDIRDDDVESFINENKKT